MPETIVIADTSPLNYLVLIGVIDVLPELFGSIVIPPAVCLELRQLRTPERVRAWAESLPDWVTVRPCSSLRSFSLDAGETEAISLALELDAAAILLDDKRAREVAHDQGLHVIGLLTIIRNAHLRGLLHAPETFRLLEATNFHIDARLVRRILDTL